MKQVGPFALLAITLTFIGGSSLGAQVSRSFTMPRRESEQQNEVPKEYLPPRGMCRIWLDGVPPNQQPAPTDCATAIRNKPRNGRVIFGEDAGDKKGKDGKDKPKKPDGNES